MSVEAVRAVLQSCVATFPWHLFGAITGVHFALTLFFMLLVGNRKNNAAVMGGADADNTKTTAEVKQGTHLASVLAYNTLAVSYAVYASYTGTTSWYDGSAEAVSATLQDRFYAYSEPYARIATLTIAYELYNTCAVVFIHEYRNAAFVFHHSTCFVLGLMSTQPFCHYYATFFFGLTAISSIPLASIELAQAAQLPETVEAFRVFFCVVFLIFRTCYWPYVSYFYWIDALAALDGAVAVHNIAAHYFLLFSNIGLTLLQFYWTSLIFRGIAEKLAPPKKKAA